MEQIFVYRTSGGKNILSNLSNEVKPIVLTVLEGILKDGLENFTTRPNDKKITPTLYEIKKKDVRIFYYRGLDNTINIVTAFFIILFSPLNPIHCTFSHVRSTRFCFVLNCCPNNIRYCIKGFISCLFFPPFFFLLCFYSLF